MVARNASGAWERQDGKLALYEDTGWAFVTPKSGWLIWDEAERALSVFDGQNWQAAATGAAPTPTPSEPAAPSSLYATEEAIFDLARDTGELTIPSHITFLGATARVLEQVTGPVNWNLGTNGSDGRTRFGSGLNVAKGTEIRGPADPPQVYWTSENIVLTPRHGSFTGGRVTVAIHYIRLPYPALS